MDTKRDVNSMDCPRGVYKRGFTIRELAVSLACLLVAAGLLASLSGANRDLSKASVCTSNLETMFGGLMAYVNTYNSFPPHNPYPRYTTETASKNGIDSLLDPNIGWIMTYGLAMPPPATFGNGHFKWFVLNETELPSVCTCPAANYTNLFAANPEIDTNNVESFVMQYAAFYQTSGTCRAATSISGEHGGRNPPVANPSSYFSSRVVDNCEGGVPYIWTTAKAGNPADPSAEGMEQLCWIQAIHPSEVDVPSRVYYMADSRDYRPTSVANSWPSAAISDGWISSHGNKTLLGTRHYSFANVMYLDGQVNRSGQAHPEMQWNLNYNGTNPSLRGQWRCGTFTDLQSLANLGTQHHIMPQLNIKGWERFFNNNGVAAK